MSDENDTQAQRQSLICNAWVHGDERNLGFGRNRMSPESHSKPAATTAIASSAYMIRPRARLRDELRLAR